MTFNATATDVGTHAAEAFSKRSGVCPNFPHIMIIELQSLAIPSGYVGYFLGTMPSPAVSN
jgi:transglutaminase-like putative cysteine protease